MNIPKPFIPLRVRAEGLEHKVEVVGRQYTIGADGMISSIISQGQELLSGPMRIVLNEDGDVAEFDNDYACNESESFIQSRSDEETIICGCKQSKRFIVDFCNRIHYDGNIDIDFKVMTRGLTVAEVFGVSKIKPLEFKLDNLWLEVPLRRELVSLYQVAPNCSMIAEDGKVYEMHTTSTSGKLPKENVALPFRPLLWLGNEELGLGYFAENNRHWQPESEDRSIEIVQNKNEVVLRLRLLDSHPKAWDGDLKEGAHLFAPIDFSFGFHATPVKPFPKNPYVHNAFHVDCGTKIKGNYIDYFKQDNRFDLLKERGVDTLILHEKWNKCQNWFELSEYTANQLRYIVDECHKRGIKVLPYFGYELSSMAPIWSKARDEALVLNEEGKHASAWWRVPFQRDYMVCYNSSYADLFVDGIAKLMDEFNIDGVYLDSTAQARICYSTEHGCGWYDANGNLCGTYMLRAIRRLFQRLSKVVKERGGHINIHTFGAVNFMVMPYVDQNWFGENLQFELMNGEAIDVNLDYFRTEYTGRNIGVPVELIVYENRPMWTFENALSMCLIHGILPRPNHIDFPLKIMSETWDIIGRFPVEKSQWMPYWKNNTEVSHEKVKVSYYKYTDFCGEDNMLVFVSNTSGCGVDNVTLRFEERVSIAKNVITGETDADFTYSLGAYDYKILFVK